MPWYRTHGGRLIHGTGGLAAVYEARGWPLVDDAVAVAEVASGAAQARADVEAELAHAVDVKTAAKAEADAAKKKAPARRTPRKRAAAKKTVKKAPAKS